jgi:DNA-binding transcriptional LysR family regulator
VYRPLFGSRLVVVSPRGNPFRIPERPTLDDIARVPFISFPPRGTIDATIKSIMQMRRLEFRSIISANTFSLLLEYVRTGLGVTILDIFTVYAGAHLYDVFELADDLPDRLYVIIWRKNKRFADQVMAFMELLSESAAPPGCTKHGI